MRPADTIDVADLEREKSEAQFQSEVLRIADMVGWSKRYHTYNSRRSEAGFPDLVICNPDAGYTIFVEMKTNRGTLTAAQWDWLDVLRRTGQFALVWRPDMMSYICDFLESPREYISRAGGAPTCDLPIKAR